MSDERKLTEEERVKIQRLLESGTLENVTLALSLIEEAAGQEDIAELFTMNVIVELICLNGPESVKAMVRAGHLILRCPATWKRFSEAVVDPTVLTSQKNQIINETVEYIECNLEGHTDYVDQEWRFNDGRFTFISLAAAERLASMGRDITLDGLSELSDAAAESLSRSSEVLTINGLTSLSDAQAESLSKHEGESLELGGLLKLSDAAADSLSKYKGNLSLHGLTELSDAAAERLNKHEGRLDLDGLTELSNAAAVQLGSHNNLLTSTKIKRQIRKAISTRKEQARNSTKTGQTALTKKQAVKLRKLFRSKDADNVLVAVKLIDASEATLDDIIDVLSVSVLSLLVNTWDIGVWNALAPLLLSYPDAKREFTELANKRIYQQSKYGFNEDFYRDVTKPLALLDLRISPGELNGLTSLSDAAAECLTKHGGTLHLNGLTSISDAAVVILSKHEGTLSLDGLTDLSDAAAESLTKHEGRLNLRGLTSLSDAAAESLTKHEGRLFLRGLTSLSDAAAESVSKYEGDIDLRCLTSLSDGPGHIALAERLSNHKDRYLSLSGLTSLSAAAAERLSKYKGELWLNGLNELSDAAAENLSKQQGYLYLSDNLPASAAQILRDAGHGE